VTTNRNEQAKNLALQAFVQPAVYFRCNKCSNERSELALSICMASYNAVSAGWRIDVESCRVYCPSCAGELI
jgi:hypothetical protein